MAKRFGRKTTTLFQEKRGEREGFPKVTHHEDTGAAQGDLKHNITLKTSLLNTSDLNTSL